MWSGSWQRMRMDEGQSIGAMGASGDVRNWMCMELMEGADLAFAHLKEADLTWAHLGGANLNNAVLALSGRKQGIGPQMVDTHWGETNLAVVDWSQVKKLGEEHEAQQKKTSRGKVKGKAIRLDEYQDEEKACENLSG